MERHLPSVSKIELPLHGGLGDSTPVECHVDADLDDVSIVPPPRRKVWFIAILSLVVGVLSTVPYNMVLVADPGSPLFVAFVQHLVVICTGLPKANKLIYHRKIPIMYHIGCVFMGYLFTSLKSDAYSRIPISLGQLLMNTQMLVGVVVQFVLFGQRYSIAQLVGCGFVTVGVAWATHASRGAKAVSTVDTDVLETSAVLIGAIEMLVAILALCLLGSLSKLAFTKHGTHTDEQVCIQHFLSIPLFLVGGQWAKIGPRGINWVTEGHWWRWALLLLNSVLAYADRILNAEFVGCAPNLLLVQLVQTIKKFIRVLIAVLVTAPPFPSMGFWIGTGLLVIGTLKFLAAPESPDSHGGKQKNGA